MSHTLSISDALYSKLEAIVHKRGLKGIEHLLEELPDYGKKNINHVYSVHKIDELREHLFIRYGEMSDSVDLIREDRTR